MDAHSCPTKRDGVLAQKAGESLVLLSVSTGNYYSLDEVGMRIWELLDGRSLHAVAEALTEEYEAPLANIERDVLELVADLERENLVVNSSR